jgi:hypothetical protein
MAFVERDGEGGTLGIEVGNCIPSYEASALAFGTAADADVVVAEIEGCMARKTEQRERLIQRHWIVSPIPPRMLSRQQPCIELATFP